MWCQIKSHPCYNDVGHAAAKEDIIDREYVAEDSEAPAEKDPCGKKVDGQQQHGRWDEVGVHDGDFGCPHCLASVRASRRSGSKFAGRVLVLRYWLHP